MGQSPALEPIIRQTCHVVCQGTANRPPLTFNYGYVVNNVFTNRTRNFQPVSELDKLRIDQRERK